MKLGVIHLFLILSLISVSHAENTPTQQDEQLLEIVDIIDWDLAQKRLKSISKVGYHPFLMPLIMENRDFIELTNDQMKVFMDWRKKNRVAILHLMNKIIYELNLFHKLSLEPNTRDEVLLAKQEQIFKMHRKVLEYQLSCRRHILDTFTEQQWDNFRFVLSENGYDIEQ